MFIDRIREIEKIIHAMWDIAPSAHESLCNNNENIGYNISAMRGSSQLYFIFRNHYAYNFSFVIDMETYSAEYSNNKKIKYDFTGNLRTAASDLRFNKFISHTSKNIDPILTIRDSDSSHDIPRNITEEMYFQQSTVHDLVFSYEELCSIRDWCVEKRNYYGLRILNFDFFYNLSDDVWDTFMSIIKEHLNEH